LIASRLAYVPIFFFLLIPFCFFHLTSLPPQFSSFHSTTPSKPTSFKPRPGKKEDAALPWMQNTAENWKRWMFLKKIVGTVNIESKSE
jgi:hypothetical protein